MIKIMIVDDEAIFRDYLKTTVDWESYGFAICCEARNGLEALQQAELHLPDIALVDINMPFMDGLELTQRLKEKDRDMGVVLLTGHSEFEYARKALRIGADDYITKPFSKEELILTLLRLQENIIQSQGARSRQVSQQELLKEQLLSKMLASDTKVSEDAVKEQLAYAGIRTSTLRFKVACVEIDNMDEKWNEITERLLWRFAVSNVLKDIVDVEGNHLLVPMGDGRIVSIIEFADAASEAAFDINTYGQLCEMVKKYLKFTITVGIGSTCSGFGGIPQSYKEAQLALQSKFVLGGNRSIEYEKHLELSSNIGFYPTEMQEELLAGLRLHNGDKVEEALNRVFRYMTERRLSMEYAYVVYMGLISLCLSYVTEAGYHIEDIYGEGFVPFSEIRKLETVEEANHWVARMFGKTVSLTASPRLTRSRQIAETAKRLIEEQYSDPELGVERVAQQSYIHSSYLRAVFKKEFGLTLNDYLVQVRMNKAKELIRTGQIKLADIAEMIGYSDAGYFSKSFKKLVGVSPSEYEIRSKS